MAIPNPVSFWNFDESTLGSNAADATATGNTLTNNGTAAFTTGLIGNAAVLVAASSQSFSITNAAQTGLGVTGDFTIAMWWNFTTNIEETLLGKFGASGHRSYRVYKASIGGGNFRYELGVSSSGSGFNQVVWNHTPTILTWYHLVFTYAASAHTAECYINASSQGTGDITETSVFSSDAPFGTGVQNGKMDMFGFWNSVLSSSDISALYNAGVGLQYPFPTSGPANLKTYNTNPKANIKTIDTNPIANVKTLDTNA